MSGIRKVIGRINTVHDRFFQYNCTHPGKRFYIIKTTREDYNKRRLIDEFGVYDYTTKKFILQQINHLKCNAAIAELEALADRYCLPAEEKAPQ